jgi:hypothetical protein
MVHLDNLFLNVHRSSGGSHGWCLGCSLDWGLRGCGHGLEGLHHIAELGILSIKELRSQGASTSRSFKVYWNVEQKQEVGPIKSVKHMPCKWVTALVYP